MSHILILSMGTNIYKIYVKWIIKGIDNYESGGKLIERIEGGLCDTALELTK